MFVTPSSKLICCISRPRREVTPPLAQKIEQGRNLISHIVVENSSHSNIDHPFWHHDHFLDGFAFDKRFEVFGGKGNFLDFLCSGIGWDDDFGAKFSIYLDWEFDGVFHE